MFWRKEKRRTATYTTSDWDGGKDDEPKDPIVAVCVLPKGPTHVLDEIQDCYGSKKWISIGAGDDNDIQIRERLEPGEKPSVSWTHCELRRTPKKRALIRRSKDSYNNTKVNRARIHNGEMELAPGDVVEIGRVAFVALSASGVQRIKVTADEPQDYVERMVKTHGTRRRVAALFDVDPSTISRWLKGRFRSKPSRR